MNTQDQNPTEPNNSQPNYAHSEPNKSSKNTLLYIIIGILGVAVLSLLAYLFIFKDSDTKTDATKSISDSIRTEKTKDSIKIDTTSIAKKGENEYEGEGEYSEPFTESYVIASEAFLRSAPNLDASSKVKSLKFGDKIYVKDYYSENGMFHKVYLTKPANETNPSEQMYYLSASTVVESYSFTDFKESFSLEPFSKLDSKVKKLILDEDYYDGTRYSVSQNSDRVKSAICFGDFDADGIKDIAVALDNNEKQTSRVLLICHNKASKEPYLAFADNYVDKVKINSFTKGARMFMDSDELVASPTDGIIIKSESAKLAMIYDKDNLKFKTFYQE